MNNDTIVAPDFLQSLMQAVNKERKNYQIYSPLILSYFAPEVIWSVTDRLIPGTMIGYNPFIGKKVAAYNFPEILPADFVNGCSLLIHRDVINKIGLFDPKLFMYFEEVDFAWRAKRAGYKMACATKARMWHKISKSSNKQKQRSIYLRIRNQIWVYRRYSQGIEKTIMFVFSIYSLIKVTFQNMGFDLNKTWPYIWKGFLDGWRNNPETQK